MFLPQAHRLRVAASRIWFTLGARRSWRAPTAPIENPADWEKFRSGRKGVLRPQQKESILPGRNGVLSKNDSRTVLSPTDAHQPGRQEETAEERRQMQSAKSRGQLLRSLTDAVSSDRIDASVFGSAMQRCGQSRWWDTLEEVREMQKKADISSNSILVAQYFTALAKSARGEKGFGSVLSRQMLLVPRAKQAWQEMSIESLITAPVIGSALFLCAAAGDCDPSALYWAEDLHALSASHEMTWNVVHYSSFAIVLEEHNLRDRVDQLMLASKAEGWTPNEVFLGGLVNVAANKRDWRRADKLWKTSVSSLGIVPHPLAYGALAKAHLLCGQPRSVARIADDMMGKGLSLTPEFAESYIQALLIVYHSDLGMFNSLNVEKAIYEGRPIINTASSRQKQTLKQMNVVFGRLRSSPSSVRLHQVLVEWNAQQSVMSQWENHRAGTKYLCAE